MNTQIHLPSRSWIVVALGVILLFAHGLIVYFARHHLRFSATILSGVAVIVLIKHLGAFRSIFSVVRKHGPNARDRSS